MMEAIYFDHLFSNRQVNFDLLFSCSFKERLVVKINETIKK